MFFQNNFITEYGDGKLLEITQMNLSINSLVKKEKKVIKMEIRRKLINNWRKKKKGDKKSFRNKQRKLKKREKSRKNWRLKQLRKTKVKKGNRLNKKVNKMKEIYLKISRIFCILQ